MRHGTSALLFGIVPAWIATRSDAEVCLKGTVQNIARRCKLLLYGLQPNDPLVFAASATLLGVNGLAAAWVPARRAAAVQPMEALRHE